MIHPLADCQSKNIPQSTNIWQYCVVFPKAKIGENCNICSHCLIENDVVVGDNCTIKCGVQLWDGIELEANVMIGANCTFTNDMYPRSKNKDWKLLKTKVCKGASIGAGSVILPGITIGSHSMIGAGSVVTKSFTENNIIIAGNPAKIISKIDKEQIYLQKYYHNTRNMNYEEKKKYLMQLSDEQLKLK